MIPPLSAARVAWGGAVALAITGVAAYLLLTARPDRQNVQDTQGASAERNQPPPNPAQMRAIDSISRASRLLISEKPNLEALTRSVTDFIDSGEVLADGSSPPGVTKVVGRGERGDVTFFVRVSSLSEPTQFTIEMQPSEALTSGEALGSRCDRIGVLNLVVNAAARTPAEAIGANIVLIPQSNPSAGERDLICGYLLAPNEAGEMKLTPYVVEQSTDNPGRWTEAFLDNSRATAPPVIDSARLLAVSRRVTQLP